MSTHQVITGALNKGENVYAIGSVEGTIFTVCAVGSDVVILGTDFQRIQIIPGCSHQYQQLVTSVSCCQDSGRVIAATYGNIIRIFEPTNTATEKTSLSYHYQWIETQCLTVKEQVNTVLWNMDGLRMMVVLNDEMFLYQHRSVSCMSRAGSTVPVMFCIAEEDQQDSCSWDIVWSIQLAQPPKYMKYSPDGAFLAIAGENDYLVKVFYQESNENDPREQLSFNFVTLHHPAAVRGLEWRKTGRYMPRKCIQSVLITWCVDNTSRLWKETPPPELAIIDITGDGGEPAWERTRPRTFFGKHFRVKKTRNKIMAKLKGIVPEKKRRTEEPHQAGLGLRAQIGKSPSFSDLQAAHCSYTNVQFHLAASINAETDCLLVPSMENGSALHKPLCVHWLNNKELVFSIGAEKLLAEALLGENDPSRRSANFSPCEIEQDELPSPNGHSEKSDRPNSAYGSVCSETPSSKDILDVKLEILLRQWSKSNDILFTIHPVDGSLLTWYCLTNFRKLFPTKKTVEWMDDLHRQPVVSFTSRFPAAFPITDASSLHPTLNTFNPHEPIYVDVLRREGDGKDIDFSVNDRILERRISNTINVLTNHENGSLNLWHMAVDENSNFSTILNITHISRMCGHRFQINQIVAHPVLPLLLTSSQFRSGEDLDLLPGALSEVILWKIAPVGPLCKSGGVKELARVASPSRHGFDCLGWIPAILPRLLSTREVFCQKYTMQTVKKPILKKSIRSLTPPRKLLSPGLLQQFRVVSTQSTAKPGCVLEVGQILDAITPNTKLLLLHVFNERLVLAADDTESEDVQSRMGTVIDRSKSAVFNDRYFVVMVEKSPECDSFLMYSLDISSQHPQMISHFDNENFPDEKGFLRPASPLAPSVAKLFFEGQIVCEQRVPLPSGVRVVSATPAAGHLPSSSLYPACEAPFVMLTSCSDDVVRFWRCVNAESSSDFKYEWREWNMISDNKPSELEVEGMIYSVSAAHSGRIACAYDPRCGGDLITLNTAEVEIGVFECESSGGVEWMREDTLPIKNGHE
uniref:WD_REPEATS_REGION domain-containing protein n=1 Tax=Heterorhabditis bacteriophora TaxID=37862 RepID=A0A1I7WD60_HETBA